MNMFTCNELKSAAQEFVDQKSTINTALYRNDLINDLTNLSTGDILAKVRQLS